MKRILKAGITKYEKRLAASQLSEDDPMFQQLHQPSGRSLTRLRKKALARNTWYKATKDLNKTATTTKRNKNKQDEHPLEVRKTIASTVMFLPNTKGGILLKEMREKEPKWVEISGFKMSYSEMAGTKLGSIFTPNLSEGLPCGRNNRQPCNINPQDKLQNCRKRSILYQSVCTLCNPQDVKNPQKPSMRDGVYFGETSRSLAERAAEHYRDGRNFDKSSHMIKHWLEKHQELNTLPPFQISILRSFRDALSRQISEAIAIFICRDALLNTLFQE